MEYQYNRWVKELRFSRVILEVTCDISHMVGVDLQEKLGVSKAVWDRLEDRINIVDRIPLSDIPAMLGVHSDLFFKELFKAVHSLRKQGFKIDTEVKEEYAIQSKMLQRLFIT